MLPEKNAALIIRILSLLLAAALSFFVVTAMLPESNFVKDSLKSVEDSSNTVMKLSAATLSASLAITALPDDFATPLASTLSDMSFYFVAILVVLFLEKILIVYGIKVAFKLLIPLACVMGALSIIAKRITLKGSAFTLKGFACALKGLAVRLCVLGLAIAFVVPCNTHITEIVASDLTAYVNQTIEETEGGADKLNEAMGSGTEDKTIFEKLSDLFQTAIQGISDLLVHFQNIIRKCMNSIAILILTNCLMPLLTFFVLRWILKELFQIVIPVPPLRRSGTADPEADSEAAAVGEKSL